MNARARWVPIKVPNSTTHSARTRLIWLLLGLRSSGPSSLTDIRLRKLSGLDRKTIAAARTTHHARSGTSGALLRETPATREFSVNGGPEFLKIGGAKFPPLGPY